MEDKTGNIWFASQTMGSFAMMEKRLQILQKKKAWAITMQVA